ncbi:uncharacterized protein LOC117087779 [Trachypithecus francoisi]|uniref:uncharacterized protein LOC117087779 n=1 Tax=Trachypithecus francoisi TaxID=54180 RepID=UPI00141B3C0C|nr:uncharacterized protein LOC117087779 [Trachypithecus francoisi]
MGTPSQDSPFSPARVKGAGVPSLYCAPALPRGRPLGNKPGTWGPRRPQLSGLRCRSGPRFGALSGPSSLLHTPKCHLGRGHPERHPEPLRTGRGCSLSVLPQPRGQHRAGTTRGPESGRRCIASGARPGSFEAGTVKHL